MMDKNKEIEKAIDIIQKQLQECKEHIAIVGSKIDDYVEIIEMEVLENMYNHFNNELTDIKNNTKKLENHLKEMDKQLNDIKNSIMKIERDVENIYRQLKNLK